MAFPSSPTVGQEYTQDDRTWKWDGVAWEVLALPGPQGPPGPPGVASATAPLALASGVLSIDLSAYAPLASPVFTGDARAVTPASSDNDTSIATTAFVKAQGYLTSAPVISVAGRTGAVTLANTDISGLGTMATATAADYSTTSAANLLYYPLSSNPAGYLTSAPVTSVAGRTGAITLAVADISGAAPLASPSLTGTPISTTAATDTNTTQIATTAYVVSQAGSATPLVDGTAAVGTSLRYARQDHVHPTDTSRAALSGATFTGEVVTPASTTGTAGLMITPGVAPSAPVNGEIWATTTDLQVRLNGVTETIAEQSWVAAQGFLTSAPVTSVAGRTGAITLAVADVSGAAPLASPTFTGTPSLPTGTTAVTQTVGNNTTAVATTAFVTAAVPAFATLTEARQFSNTTKVLSPSLAMWSMLSADIIYIQRSNFTTTNVGSVQYVAAGSITTETRLAASAASSSRSRPFGPSQVDQSQSATVRSNISNFVNFSLRTFLGARSATFDITDPVLTMAFYYGKAEADGVGDLTRRGMGWKVTGGTGSRFLTLQVHNGTTLTSVTSSFAVIGGQAFDWDIISDGAGNVTLYVNGSSVATTSAGPTGLHNLIPVVWQEEYSTSGVPALSFHTSYNSRGRMAVINY